MFYKTQDILNIDNLRFAIIQYADCLPMYPHQELQEAELEKYMRAKSRKRKLEIYYGNVLWNKFKTDENITYSNYGSPEIKNGFVSKSHSQQEVGILASENCAFGIDLEAVTDKIHRIKERFLHIDEKSRFNIDNTLELTRIWSIKEATFKFLKLSGVTFKTMLCVTNLDDNQGTIIVDHPKFKGVLAVKHWLSVNEKMVYTLVGKPEDISIL